MTDLGPTVPDTLPRRTFRFRGKDRPIGGVKVPPILTLLETQAISFFHRLFGATPANGANGGIAGPIPPPSCDYWTAAKVALGTMLLNDQLGDCVCAEDLHLSAMRAANAGTVWVPSDAEALTLYQIVGGYVPGDSSTDQGCDPMALVKYRLANPYPDGAKLLDARQVDATSDAALRQGIWLATGCFAWGSLPAEWESEEGADDVWDVAGDPVPANGHAFGLVCYSDKIRVTTWGEEIDMTFAAAAKYLTPSAGGGVLALIDSRCTQQMVLAALDAEAS